jgi:predicted permease
LALAIGIGATVSVFTLLDALVLRPLPLPHPEQLVELTGNYRSHSLVPLSYPMFAELERDQRVFTGICGWTAGTDFSVEIDGKVSLGDVRSVTGNYYSVLGALPALGRLIDARDADDTHGSQVAVIGYELWKERFGGDPAVAGKTLHIDGKLFTIIGVTPKWFTGMTVGYPPEITIPAGALPTYDLQSRHLLWLTVTGRLRAGESLQHASAQLNIFWPQLLQATVPTESTGERRQSFLAMGLQLDPVATGAETQGDLRAKVLKPLNLLLGVAGLILLVICVNLASLTLARATARRQEISTRIALGASRWQAVRQFVAETFALSCIGAGVALFLSFEGSRVLIAWMTRGEPVPALLDVRPDWRVLCFAAAVAVFTGLLAGLLPAWQLSRQSPGAALRESGRTVGRGPGRLGKSLIVFQIATSLVLLQAAGLFLRTLQSLKAFNAGFDKVGVMELDLSPTPLGYQGVDMDSYRRQLADAVSSLPSARSAAFSDSRILADSYAWRDTVSRLSATDAANGVASALVTVSPGFFRTLGIPLVAGRDFAWSDDKRHPPEAIVDSALARQLFPGESAIGKRISFGVQPELHDLEVVGVSEAARLLDVRDGHSTFIYVPATQFGFPEAGGTLVVGGSPSPAFIKTLDSEVASFGREFSTRTSTLAERSDGALVNEETTATLSSVFAFIALLVSGFGLFGLLSYSMTLRIREIGIRMALGSQRKGILRLVLNEALQVTVLGIAIGIPCAILVSRTFAQMLFAISFTDPTTILTASIVLLATGVIAGLFPAWRAMHLNPMAALRHE